MTLILFWSGASDTAITSAGNIPAHLEFVALLFHLALARSYVPAIAVLSPIVTGLLYLLVNGIYTLASQKPVYSVFTWKNGNTAAVVFIGLAIILVSFAALFFLSRWRDILAARRRVGTIAPPLPISPQP